MKNNLSFALDFATVPTPEQKWTHFSKADTQGKITD